MPHSKIEVDTDAALARFLELTKIPGISGEEADVAAAIVAQLKAAGVADSQIHFDDAHTKTALAGNCGNLIVTLPGNGSGPRTMLSAHMDTVPICVGSQPKVVDDEVISDSETGLGADDRGGCAAILTAVTQRMAVGDGEFSPAVICFLIQEEIGLHGARHIDVASIGKVDQAFNFDGGSVEKLTNGAIGGERMTITLCGVPSHAGAAPQNGASAIIMAARAIANLDSRGWLGLISNEHGVGTANVGVIQGGEATNVITPKVSIRAEARSHDSAMRSRIVAEIKNAFENAAASVKTESGIAGRIEFASQVDYESFKLDLDHPSIRVADAAVRKLGRTPYIEVANGGLDANWLFLHGIEAVTLGCGQKNIHTADERLVIADYLDACRIATDLITS
ncbi:M20/M25/M40 family metallo-hydrolase [Rubripirellula obstinata]|uniref:M20/M25/M40 family metallo-hydrolase n=1 Tax=Rubripirellula obstinata TaxID=406547 RepID=UPI00190F82F3|nr:M20/M25/M40 family metallo-hydrolase [Rubripirellula obstinata]